MRGTLLRRRNTHDSRQSGLATAFCDDRQAADRNHLFVTQSGFGPGFKKSDHRTADNGKEARWSVLELSRS
jgi:hypothetical protein